MNVDARIHWAVPPCWTSRASARISRSCAQTIRGKPLVFLDSAASAQKPRAVIDAMRRCDGDAVRQRPSRPALDERARPPMPTKPRATRSPRFINARDRHEVVFTRNITECDQPDGAQLWPRRDEAGPGGADLRDGAPLQHRALAVAARRPRASSCASRRSPMPASSTWTLRGAAGRRQGRAGRRSRTCPTCWAPTRRPSASCGSRMRTAPRCCSTAPGGGASARRRAGAGLRFLRLHRPQAVWPDRHRRAVGPARAAGRDAAVPRRRRDDFIGHATSAPPGPRCRTSSRPARRRSSKASA